MPFLGINWGRCFFYGHNCGQPCLKQITILKRYNNFKCVSKKYNNFKYNNFKFLLLLQRQRNRMLPILTCLQKKTLIRAEFLQHEIERNWSGMAVAVMWVCGMGWRELTNLTASSNHNQALEEKRLWASSLVRLWASSFVMKLTRGPRMIWDNFSFSI